MSTAISNTSNSNPKCSTSSSLKKRVSLVTLISQDDQIFQIPKSAAILSMFIRDTLGFEDDKDQDDDDSTDNEDDYTTKNSNNNFNDDSNVRFKIHEPVHVMRVRGVCLKRVVEFLEKYDIDPLKDITVPLEGNSFEEIVRQDWYRDFLNRCMNEYDAATSDGTTSTTNSIGPLNSNMQLLNLTTCSSSGDSRNSCTVEGHSNDTTTTGTTPLSLEQNDNENQISYSNTNIATSSNTNENDNNREQYSEKERPSTHNFVIELLAAANYMSIKPLLDLTCLWVTFQLQGSTAEQIRTFLNLPPITPEEEARAREEHPWIFEET